MGYSGSFTLSGVPNSPPSDSLNGLKFGRKLYFEDAGVGAPAKSGGGSPSSGGSGGPPVAAKKVKGAAQGGQPPRCQVAGCKVDLSEAKAYYSRHKVCGVHSKSPKVIVAGLEQRFCQQCSRFHQLPEFDEVKRSCRRRLAGHNERRRKPPPGSLFPSRYGRFSSPVFENCSSGGGILVNFSSYATCTGKYPERPWHSKALSNASFITQGSTAGTGCLGTKIPSGECFTGASNSDRALSLLSNQSWASRIQASGLGVDNLMNHEGTPVLRTTVPNTSCFVSCCSDEIPPHQGLGQVSHPMNGSELTGVVELAQQSGRPYMEFEHCKAYDSTHLMHWSL